MKSILFFAFIMFRALGAEETTYTTKYDSVDLNEILSSERLLTGYVNCLLDQGPCTPDGKELKRNIPDAIGSDCSKCTEKQKEGSDRVMEFIIDNRPDDWAKLEKKYLSDGSYKKKYLAKKKADELPSDDRSKADQKTKEVDDKKDESAKRLSTTTEN